MQVDAAPSQTTQYDERRNQNLFPTLSKASCADARNRPAGWSPWQFGFADFKSLDRDWAHDFMFRKTKPAIWRRVLSDSELPPMIDTDHTSELVPVDEYDIVWDYIDRL